METPPPRLSAAAYGGGQRSCYPSPLCSLMDHYCSQSQKHRRAAYASSTTTRASRSEFAASTASSFFPNTIFTNHESLPGFSEAFSTFIDAYPRYLETEQADRLREAEYAHLSDHTCFDYSGIGLLSSSSNSGDSDRPATSFAISYKPQAASLKYELQYRDRDKETGLETDVQKRIMSFLNVDPSEYAMIYTANRTTAFKLLADCYPFQTHKKLLTVYDYDSEGIAAVREAARKKGARTKRAKFSWPSLRIHAANLEKKLTRRKKTKSGLFVFPLQSRMTGARYPYLWMRFARENGWHVVLDACALGPKDLDTLGVSFIKPDFIVSTFFKVFGENPSGFAALFVKKSIAAFLETPNSSSLWIRSIVASKYPESSTATQSEEDNTSHARSFSGPIPAINADDDNKEEQKEEEITEVEISRRRESKIELRALDHADSLGLCLINNRLRCITNWLVSALTKLRHPDPDLGHAMVQIYGPKIKFDRGPTIAFNVIDWKGEKVEPSMVQKLADRNGISLSCGFLTNICFSEKQGEERAACLERKVAKGRKVEEEEGIAVVNASLGFLTSFEDAYRLWTFVAKFLDADFVEKERWRYMALNQKLMEVL